MADSELYFGAFFKVLVIFDTQNIVLPLLNQQIKEKHVLMQADVLKGISCQQLNVQHKWSATFGHCLF